MKVLIPLAITSSDNTAFFPVLNDFSVSFNILNNGKYATINTYIYKLMINKHISGIPNFSFVNICVYMPIIIDSNITYIGSDNFKESQVSEIICKGSLSEIREFAFFQSSLSKMTVYGDIGIIKQFALSQTPFLKHLVIKDGTAYIKPPYSSNT